MTIKYSGIDKTNNLYSGTMDAVSIEAAKKD